MLWLLPFLIITSLLRSGLNLIVVPTTFETVEKPPRPVAVLANRFVDEVVPNLLPPNSDWVLFIVLVPENRVLLVPKPVGKKRVAVSKCEFSPATERIGIRRT